MIRISLTPAAFDAIAATLPLGSVGFESELDAKGERSVWIDDAVANKLIAMRGPGESFKGRFTRAEVPCGNCIAR
ncbi:MAG: hypothetical protein JO223_12905 [Hyphomicrobiales bacterium]|nr:hypothetical protein [Hyphomicrobiales bacterium]